MLQYYMKSFVFAFLLILAVPASAQTWLHIYGLSKHESPGYQEINAGIGIEQQFAEQWSWGLGTYRNSIYRQSMAGMVKYQWYQQGDFSVNMQMGGVTGYRRYAVAPVILPETCWSWICGMFVPRIENETRAAVAVYLRIPL